MTSSNPTQASEELDNELDKFVESQVGYGLFHVRFPLRVLAMSFYAMCGRRIFLT
jgi:hypothetical protein